MSICADRIGKKIIFNGPMLQISRTIKILLTGATSIHGWPIYERLRRCIGPERLFAVRPPKMAVPEGENVRSLCVTDETALVRIRDAFAPTHVIHCAGVCDLDVCEERPAWARSINTVGTRTIAGVFGASSFILYLSTDLVFSGNSTPSGGYDETAKPDPVSVAGRTFADAETELDGYPRVCIVRLGLPIGASITNDKGAIDFIDSRLRRGLPLTLFHDEIRSCISCEAIAGIVPRILAREVTGIFHLGGDSPRSLYEIGKYVIERGGYPPALLSTISRFEEKNGPPRIGDVTLDSGKIKTLLGLTRIPEK